MVKKSTNYLYLSSKMRTDGFSNNFEILFNNSNPLFTLKDGERLTIKPLQVQLPNDWDAVNSSNNKFKLIYNSVEHVITIPTGNPDTTQIVDTIEELINSAVNIANEFAVTFDDYEKRIDIVANSLNFTLDFSLSNSANYLLGFNRNQVISSIGKVLTAPNKPDLQPYSAVLFHSNVAKKSLSVVNQVLSNVDVLFSIPINENVGSNILWENTSDMFEQEVNSNISSFTFKLTDMTNNLIAVEGDVNVVFELTKYKDE